MKEIEVGASATKEVTVTHEMLAVIVGSGDVGVLSTPMMIATMEGAAAKCLTRFLDEGMTSVGSDISTSHLAATPLMMKITATAEVIAVDGKKITFAVSAKDEKDVIGEGLHTRIIVNRDKFVQRANAKL